MTPDEAPDLERIWWLASYPKSGNTWVRMFVNCYVSGRELKFKEANPYVTGDLNPPIWQSCCAFPLTQAPYIINVYSRPHVLLQMLALSRRIDICLKTHHALVAFDDIALIPERLTRGAVYVVRDPRDIVDSLAKHMDYTLDEAIDMMVHPEMQLKKEPFNLHHVLTSWSGHVDSWTALNTTVNTTVVRYEDLLSDPEEQFGRVIEGLGLPAFGVERFDFAIEQASLRNLQEMEDAQGFDEVGKSDRFFRHGQAGRWRDVLSDSQVERVERAFGHSMTRMGYELETVKVSDLEGVRSGSQHEREQDACKSGVGCSG